MKINLDKRCSYFYSFIINCFFNVDIGKSYRYCTYKNQHSQLLLTLNNINL